MLRTDTPITIHRHAYLPPAFQIEQVQLVFDLSPAQTVVRNQMRIKRMVPQAPLVLHGQGLTLLGLTIDGKNVADYRLDEESLTLPHVPDDFDLEIVTSCNPEANTSLMGLYVSSGNFFTQCEAEGFRKITYFMDRPDVMARYTVTLRADKVSYPVLLSNGNLIEQGDLPDGRHYAVWDDPFLKPSYLFALVAGKLVCIEERIQGMSGKDKLLQVWVEARDLDKTQHAMDALIHSIRWDETRFGLELDLDRFMIVAVGDFNMGAMENKGLNIFNTKFVLAKPATATDVDYANIESVVAHEYFHNWTGNRVTCRDWFQLSLKEGLTVFRDQEFSADMMGSASGRAVKRIEDVRMLRQVQFPEDAGPMAHPVRPDSYQEINNFYTVTIYEKGAEVVRMYQTLLGRDGFRKGMDLYFQRHDGQAVTCDDFLAAMADANGRDLCQFARWYSQAGTPRVQVTTQYDAATASYTLKLVQSCAATPGQTEKLPFHLPFAVGLLDAQGQALPLRLSTDIADDAPPTTRVLELTQAEQCFTFMGIPAEPVPSLLRDFSAPVVLDYDYRESDLLHLIAHDSDPFNRWEAGQRLALQRLLGLVADVRQGKTLQIDASFIDAWRRILQDTTLDPAFRELALTLPSETYVAEQMTGVDPQAVHAAREFLRQALACELAEDWAQAWQAHQSTTAYAPDAVSAGRRGLKNLALAMLLESGAAEWQQCAWQQYQETDNMTDRFAALSALVNTAAPQAAEALTDFHARFADEPLVLDKWFALQASARPSSAPQSMVDRIRQLLKHPDFTLKNPNRARSVVHTFCIGNTAGFHTPDGAGYAFWAEQVLVLDAINPQVAARLARALDRWRHFSQPYSSKMQEALKHVQQAGSSLSRDTAEVIGKALQ